MSTTKLALITILEHRGSGGARPDNTLPQPPAVVWPPQTPPDGPGPDNTLPTPPPGFPVHLPVFPPEVDNALPGSQPRPDNTLPGGGKPPSGGKPDNTLPSGGARPDNSLPDPNQRFELKWTPVYGWVLVPVKDEVAEPKRR